MLLFLLCFQFVQELENESYRMEFLKASSNLLFYLILDGQLQAPPLIVPTHLLLLAVHLLAARTLASKHTSEQCQKNPS